MDWSDSGCFSFKCSDRIANLCPEAACFPWFMHSACNCVRARSLAEFSSFWCGVAVSPVKVLLLPGLLFTCWMAPVVTHWNLPPGQLRAASHSAILWFLGFACVAQNCLCRFWFPLPDCNWPKERRESVEQNHVLGYVCASWLILIIWFEWKWERNNLP